MANRKRKVKVVEKMETDSSPSANSKTYFRGLTDCFQRTETMRLETGNISLDYDKSSLKPDKEKSGSPLPNFKSR